MTSSQLKEIESLIPKSDAIHTNVSKASVGWHLNHILIVTARVCKVLQSSEIEAYKWKFNFKRALVFTINKIPRGRARAPKQAIPDKISSPEELQLHTANVSTKLAALDALPKNANFSHPFFGMLNKKQTITFLRIHTEHHLKIIRDILKHQ